MTSDGVVISKEVDAFEYDIGLTVFDKKYFYIKPKCGASPFSVNYLRVSSTVIGNCSAMNNRFAILSERRRGKPHGMMTFTNGTVFAPYGYNDDIKTFKMITANISANTLEERRFVHTKGGFAFSRCVLLPSKNILIEMMLRFGNS